MKKFLKNCVGAIAILLLQSMLFAKNLPIDNFKNMGQAPSGTEAYVAALKVAYDSGIPPETLDSPARDSYSCRVLSFDIAKNTSLVELTITLSPFYYVCKIVMDVRLEDDLIVTAERKFLSYDKKSSTWIKKAETSYFNGVPIINICQEFLGEKLMKVLKSSNYANIKKQIDEDPRTWPYVFNYFTNEQELANFFAQNNLLSNPITWRYVFAKCKNDLQFERFLTKHKILTTKQNISCKFDKVEMTNERQKAQYNNKRYVAQFYYQNGRIYVYTNDGKYIDNNQGDNIMLETTVSSCEYRSITGGGITSVSDSDNERWQSLSKERGSIAIDLIVIE